jgi:hypothetical protein
MNGMTYCFKPDQERTRRILSGRKNTHMPWPKALHGTKQKSSPDKSDELEYVGLNILKLDSDLSVRPITIYYRRMELAPFYNQRL